VNPIGRIAPPQRERLCPHCAAILRSFLDGGADAGPSNPTPGTNSTPQHVAHSPGSPRLKDAITAMLLSKEQSGRRPVYITSLRQYLTQFARGREDTPIAQITLADLERWFSERTEAPSARNSNLGRLSALFDHAWRHGHIPSNPCNRMENIRLETHAPSILTVEQCRKALAWTARNEDRFLAWLVLTLFVGLRPEAEADGMTWEKIDFTYKRIYVDGSNTKVKTHRLIDLKLIPPALEWLTLAKKLNSDLPLVFTARRRYIRRLALYLELPGWTQDILRHTAASYLFAYHQDAGKVATILGNSAGVLLRRYRALVPREVAEKFTAIKPVKIRLDKKGRKRTTGGINDRVLKMLIARKEATAKWNQALS